MRQNWLLSLALFAPVIYAQERSAQPATQKSAETCTLEGHVAGAIKGEPVRKAILLLSQTGVPQGQRYSTTTGSGGSFAMQDIEPGKYRLMVMKGGYAPMQYGSRSSGRAGITLSLDPGQHIRDLVIRLTPQAVISGRVLDEDGDPVPQVSLQLFQYSYSHGKRQHQPSDFAMTNDLGEYRLFDLAPGRYFLSATAQIEMDQSARGQTLRCHVLSGNHRCYRRFAARSAPRHAVARDRHPSHENQDCPDSRAHHPPGERGTESAGKRDAGSPR